MTTAQWTLYQLRLDSTEKAETFKVFDEMGVKPSQAVRWFFQHVRREKRLPFEVGHVPNAATAKVLLAPDHEKKFARFDTVDALFADLHS